MPLDENGVNISSCGSSYPLFLSILNYCLTVSSNLCYSIHKLKVFLVSEHCQDSVIIFKYLHQIIVELIEDQVNAEIISEYKDMLE